MGCGESKHDAVATGNTVVNRRKPNFNVKKHKDLGTIPEADPDAEKGSDSEVAVVAADMKDITVNSEMKMDEIEERVVDESQESVSPDRYFSSRKDEDAIKAIVDEVGSGYCTPHHEPDRDSFFDEDGKSIDAYADEGKQELMTQVEAKLVSTIENGRDLCVVEEHSSDTTTKKTMMN